QDLGYLGNLRTYTVTSGIPYNYTLHNSAKTFVDNAIASVRGIPGQITKITLTNHGGTVGSDNLVSWRKADHIYPGTYGAGSFDDVNPELLRLKPYLSKDAVLTLNGCNVASCSKAAFFGLAEMRVMARQLGIPVRGSPSTQPLGRGNITGRSCGVHQMESVRGSADSVSALDRRGEA